MPPTASQRGPPPTPPSSPGHPLPPSSMTQQAEHDLAGPSVPQWASGSTFWNKSPALSAHSIVLRINPLCISKRPHSPFCRASEEMLAPHPPRPIMPCFLPKNSSSREEKRESSICFDHCRIVVKVQNHSAELFC